MTDYLTEQEQIEILKKWIKDYSLVIIAGIVIAIMAVAGYKYWQQRQANILNQASSLYDEMLTTRAQNNSASIAQQASKLTADFSHTIYAQMAAFMLAHDAIAAENYTEAEKQFTWIIAHCKNNSFKQIARIRLARLQLAEKKPQASIDTLAKVDDLNFSGLIDEIKGDAYLALHNAKSAKLAYKDALRELPNAEVLRPLLQMKYDNI